MWLRLAALLGCTVCEAMRRMTPEEYLEWCAFYELDPWGGSRGDMHAGIIASAVFNASPNIKSPVSPADFMPEFGPVEPKPRPKQSMAEQKAIAKHIELMNARRRKRVKHGDVGRNNLGKSGP